MRRRPQTQSQTQGEAAALYAQELTRLSPNASVKPKIDYRGEGEPIMAAFVAVTRRNSITTVEHEVPEVGRVMLRVEDTRNRFLGHVTTLGVGAVLSAAMNAEARHNHEPIGSYNRDYLLQVTNPAGDVQKAKFGDRDFYPVDYWTTPQQRNDPNFRPLAGDDTLRVLSRTIDFIQARAQ